MDFEFPEETLMLRDMLRRFIQKEARPLEMQYFNNGELKPEERARLRKAIDQLGLWGFDVPEEYGGSGLDTVTACVIEEELGGTFVPMEMGNVTPLLYACTGKQISEYLEPALAGERRAIIAAREPGILSPVGWKMVAKLDSVSGQGQQSYLLNGQKVISTNPTPQDFFIIFAKTLGTTVPQGLTAFLLDSDNVQPGINPRSKSVSSTSHREIVLTLQEQRIDRTNILGEVGQALRTGSSQGLGTKDALRAWILTGARYIGMVERLIEMATEHANNWVSLNGLLSIRPAIQRMLADLRVDVESARWLVYHSAWLADTGKPEGWSMLRSAAAQVRLSTGEMLQRAVDRVTMIFTGPGPLPQIEPQRLVRCVVPSEVLDFAIEQARAVIISDMLGGQTAGK